MGKVRTSLHTIFAYSSYGTSRQWGGTRVEDFLAADVALALGEKIEENPFGTRGRRFCQNLPLPVDIVMERRLCRIQDAWC